MNISLMAKAAGIELHNKIKQRHASQEQPMPIEKTQTESKEKITLSPEAMKKVKADDEQIKTEEKKETPQQRMIRLIEERIEELEGEKRELLNAENTEENKLRIQQIDAELLALRKQLLELETSIQV